MERVGSSSGSPEISSSAPEVSVKGWDDLPPEVHQLIFGHMKIDRGKDLKALLRWRLVNSSWREAVDISMERQTLNKWFEWDVISTNERRKPQPFPYLPFAPTRIGLTDPLNLVYFPVGIWKNVASTIKTPTSSLTLCYQQEWDYRLKFPTASVQAERLLSQVGRKLTSFTLRGTEVTISQMRRIISSLPNLRALTLSLITRREVEGDDIRDTFPNISARLNHVRVDFGCDRVITQLLVDSVKNQVESLDVYANFLRSLEQRGNGDEGFQRLKMLKLSRPSHVFLQGMGVLKLATLSIVFQFQDDIEKFYDLIGFIDRVHPTLTRLHLDLSQNDRYKLEGSLLKIEISRLEPSVVYHRLKHLDMTYKGSLINYSELIKNYIVSRCPNVLCIGFQCRFTYEDTDEVVRRRLLQTRSFLRDLKLFAGCPNLKQVSLRGLDLSGAQNHFHDNLERTVEK